MTAPDEGTHVCPMCDNEPGEPCAHDLPDATRLLVTVTNADGSHPEHHETTWGELRAANDDPEAEDSMRGDLLAHGIAQAGGGAAPICIVQTLARATSVITFEPDDEPAAPLARTAQHFAAVVSSSSSVATDSPVPSFFSSPPRASVPVSLSVVVVLACSSRVAPCWPCWARRRRVSLLLVCVFFKVGSVVRAVQHSEDSETETSTLFFLVKGNSVNMGFFGCTPAWNVVMKR